MSAFLQRPLFTQGRSRVASCPMARWPATERSNQGHQTKPWSLLLKGGKGRGEGITLLQSRLKVDCLIATTLRRGEAAGNPEGFP